METNSTPTENVRRQRGFTPEEASAWIAKHGEDYLEMLREEREEEERNGDR